MNKVFIGFFKLIGERSLNNCCIGMMYEPEIPSELKKSE